MMSATDIAEWQAFDNISPIGGDRGDYHAAMLACVMAQPHAKKGKRFKLSDFLDWLPWHARARMIEEESKPKLTPQQQWERLRAMFAPFAKRDG